MLAAVLAAFIHRGRIITLLYRAVWVWSFYVGPVLKAGYGKPYRWFEFLPAPPDLPGAPVQRTEPRIRYRSCDLILLAFAEVIVEG